MAFLDDALEQFDFIDADRLGVTGGSYGGYMTNWIVTQTDRFKAAVSCRSTCNRLSHHGYSDFGFAHDFSGNMGYPWKDEEKLMRQSPIRYAANVRTPMLFIHSEDDLRCPMPGAEGFFVTLKERFSHILRWFDKYLR